MMNERTLEQVWAEHLNTSNHRKQNIFNFIKSQLQKLRIPEVLFSLLEEHLKKCEDDGSKVVVERELTRGSLQALMENEVCAIRVPNFCSPEVAESLSRRAQEEYTHWKLGGVLSTDMFYAGGSIPKEVADTSCPDFCRYFGEREVFINKQRAMSGGTWPVDQLRLELDDKWLFGACLGQYLGQKLRPAIMRIMHEKNDCNLSAPEHGFIHTDDFPKLKSAHGTFSANIYLKIPHAGGELYIWSVNLKRVKSIYHYWSAQLLTMILTKGYVFNTEWQQKIFNLLPSPHVINPQVGDLVIFHSGRPHAVAPVTRGVRVTNQLFIQARGSSPLAIYS